jgi:phage terminase large subunit-like protein
LSKKKVAVLTTLVALGLLVAQAPAAPASMYFGATISGETYGLGAEPAPMNLPAWELFERHAGKKVAVLNSGQSWLDFNPEPLDETRARGAIPMVTMGLAEGVTLAQVASGGQDAAIESWARKAKEWKHPFFFNPWWEMNGGWYSWGRSSSFVAAWRHFHDIVVKKIGATNVTWTWTVNSIWSDPASDPTAYFPGDEYVNWVGIDSYNWGRNPAQPDRWVNPDQTITPTLKKVQEIAPGKPVAIVESASSEYGGNKADWISEMLGTYLPHHPAIKAYLWFNWNFEKENGLRADWPIESSPTAQLAFRQGIQSGLFRSASPALTDMTTVPPPPAPSGGDGPKAADISPGGQDATTPQVAVAPDGTSTVVWSGLEGANFGIYERQVAADGTPEPVHQLSAAAQDAFSPQVAVGPDGTATVVWIRSDGSNFLVQERQVDPDGTLEPTKTLSATGGDAAEPQVAVAPNGAATIVWKRFEASNFRIKERRIEPDGSVEVANSHNLSAAGENAVEPQVAVAPDGTATVVWSLFDGTSSIVQEGRIAPDDTPVATVNDLSAPGQSATGPEIVVDSAGTATVAWVRSDGSDTIVQARRIPASGTPDSATHDLSATSRDAAEPQLALAPDGTVTAVWDRFDGSNFIVQGRRLTPAGDPEATTRSLSAAGRDAAEPEVAIASDGAGTVAWSRFDGSDFIVQARGLAPDGTPASGTANLSAPGRSAGGVQLTGEPLSVVWKRFDGANDIVQSAKPVASLTPDSHDFGSIELGSGDSSDLLFEVSNSGNAPLRISSISVGGTAADQFGLTGTGSCVGVRLSPGSSCKFSVVFEPSVAGVLAAQVEIVSNAATSPDAAPLSGKAFGVAVPGHPPGNPPGSPPGNAPQVAVAGKNGDQPGVIDNSFTIGRPVLNLKKGTAKLPVTLPGAGTLTLEGSGTHTDAVSGPGTISVPVQAKGGKRGILNRRGNVALALTLTFQPSGGEPNTLKTTMKLKKRLHSG